MISLPAPTRKNHKGFTLIELLVVLAIIALLLVISLPAMQGVFKTSKLSQGANQFRDHVNIAYQEAIKASHPVEVRLYKFHDPRIPGNGEYFTAYQFFNVLADTSKKFDPTAKPLYEPLTDLYRLPQGVIMTEVESQSTLLGDKMLRKKADVRGLIESKTETSVDYVAFEIRPDGSMNLPAENQLWHITFVTLQTINEGKKDDPDQYICIQFDPTNTNMSWFQTK